MTRNYTAQVDWKLTIRLHEAGFPKEIDSPLFGEVFDWLMEKGIPELNVTFYPALFEDDEETYGFTMTARLPNKNTEGYFYHPYSTSFNKRYWSWTEAATAAIEKALEIMEGAK